LPEFRRETSQPAWAARLRKPPRDEVRFEISDFDSLIDEDHPARMISAGDGAGSVPELARLCAQVPAYRWL
jgi:hypothetical protein